MDTHTQTQPHQQTQPAVGNQTTVEIGFVISLVIVLMSIVFSAGVLWSQSNDHGRRISILETEYTASHNRQQASQLNTASRLSRMETLLENIQSQQSTMAQIIKKQETGK